MGMKPNSNSIVHGLPAEQRERVDHWLFEENVSYEEVADRCRQLMNVKVSRAAVHRYYERECFRRKLEGVSSPAGDLKKDGGNIGQAHGAGVLRRRGPRDPDCGGGGAQAGAPYRQGEAQ
ncbi:MAG: hypothetical protein JWR26_2663 [Pedosphaera sp.]|nr:hypothetical protein [Pedosphaera sp.]